MGLGRRSGGVITMDSSKEDHQELNSAVTGCINVDNFDGKDEANSDTEKPESTPLERGESGEKEMTSFTGNSIHRSSSRPLLDLSGAAIQGNFEERDPTILLPNQSDDISHLALDIGGIFFCDNEFFMI